MTGKELAKELSQFVNVMANDKNEKEFIDAMMREHRTLQQNSFGLVCKLIKAWSEVEDNRYDLRNEFTVKTCQEITKSVDSVNYSPPFV